MPVCVFLCRVSHGHERVEFAAAASSLRGALCSSGLPAGSGAEVLSCFGSRSRSAAPARWDKNTSMNKPGIWSIQGLVWVWGNLMFCFKIKPKILERVFAAWTNRTSEPVVLENSHYLRVFCFFCVWLQKTPWSSSPGSCCWSRSSSSLCCWLSCHTCVSRTPPAGEALWVCCGALKKSTSVWKCDHLFCEAFLNKMFREKNLIKQRFLTRAVRYKENLRCAMIVINIACIVYTIHEQVVGKKHN